MTEKNEQPQEKPELIESTQEKTIESQATTTEKQTEVPSKNTHKIAWFKKISKQTVIVAILFFVLGGAASSIMNNLTHTKGNGADIASNKGFPGGENEEGGRPEMRNKQGGFNDEEEPNADATSGASKSGNNEGTDSSTDESNNTKAQSNA